jgi:hypothetical protein
LFRRCRSGCQRQSTNRIELGGASIFEIQNGSIGRHTACNDVIPLLHQCGADLSPEWVALFSHSGGRTV